MSIDTALFASPPIHKHKQIHTTHMSLGLVVVDGGTSVQLLYTYFPPTEQYEVQNEVWDALPTVVKVPADPK